jgi:mono/diheme cytochrome c family protein
MTLGGAAVLLVAPMLSAAPAQAPQGSSLPGSDSVSGAATYASYCAGCHGRSGRGDGPVAGSLKTPLPDLSKLAQRNGGAYPSAAVKAAVVNEARPVAAHGTGEMPVWGTVFRTVDRSDPAAGARIDRVVAFIETLQDPMTPSLAAGRELYAAYCATCHGPTGRGGGALTPALRHDVPDLTTFALRNGGMFPSVRVRQIIDGRGAASHGSREMPVWGDAFRSARGSSTVQAAAARIDSVTMFLESIQQKAGE